jgi:hypothetical protein
VRSLCLQWSCCSASGGGSCAHHAQQHGLPCAHIMVRALAANMPSDPSMASTPSTPSGLSDALGRHCGHPPTLHAARAPPAPAAHPLTPCLTSGSNPGAHLPCAHAPPTARSIRSARPPPQPRHPVSLTPCIRAVPTDQERVGCSHVQPHVRTALRSVEREGWEARLWAASNHERGGKTRGAALSRTPPLPWAPREHLYLLLACFSDVRLIPNIQQCTRHWPT